MINMEQTFKDYMRTAGLSDNTIACYSMYERTCGITETPTQADIQSILKIYPVNKVIRSFLRLYVNEFLNRRDLNIPRFRGVPEHRSIPIISRSEVETLIVAASLDYKCLIELMYYSALRVSEALSLSVKDIKNKLVIGKRNKQAHFDVCPETEAYLNEFIELQNKDEIKIQMDSKIFNPAKYNRRKVYNYVNRLGKKILGRTDIHPHSFRHNIALYMLEKGMPLISIKSLLRHASIVSTQIYASQKDEVVTDQWLKILEEK